MFTEDSSDPSIKGFKAFAESKDPKEAYKWMNPAICACGREKPALWFWALEN